MEVRGVESCSQSGCGANDLGEQLERLTVGDDEAVNEASEPSAITSGETEVKNKSKFKCYVIYSRVFWPL